MASTLTFEEKEKRKLLVEEWKMSGLSAAKWCRERGLCYNQFLYWRQQTGYSSHSFSLSSFSEVQSPVTTELLIEFQNLKIRVDKRFDLETLKPYLRIVLE